MLVDLKKIEKQEKDCHVYLQPTFFKNEIDLICVWRCGNSKYEEERVMTCRNENEVELELEKLKKGKNDK